MIVRKNESNRPLSRTGKALAASLSIAFFTASGSAVAQADLPSLGDGLELSVGDERRIGDDIIRQLYRDPDYLDDGPLQEYVQATLDALRQAARTRGELPEELDERFAWTVLLGRDRSVNAFALPGGYLGVHLGLVGVVSSRDELASVLAHELSHVSQRHIARLFAQQQRMTPLMIGTMLLGALAASKSPHAAEALMVGGQAAAIQSQLNFSRDMEREADRLGFALMAPGGFAPQGFVTMFDKLQQANRLNDNGNWPYQIYVREARRMASEFVVTENHLRRRKPSPRSIGMGSYGMDSHHVQRYVTQSGEVRNEGDVEVSTGGPYPIDYGALVPRQEECENLLVPVCVSCSHIAFGSIRMEPVFMILGQSAATAAAMAIDDGLPVQKVDYPRLRKRLLDDGQVLEFGR